MLTESSLIFAALSSGHLTAVTVAVITQQDNIQLIHSLSVILWCPCFASYIPHYKRK